MFSATFGFNLALRPIGTPKSVNQHNSAPFKILWCCVVWSGGVSIMKGMYFSQSKNALLLYYYRIKILTLNNHLLVFKAM